MLHSGSHETTLDVIIPTYNRSGLLVKALDSLNAADVPPDFSVSIVVVDNNSQDDTRAIVEAWSRRAAYPVRYLFESRQGRSRALNHGIRESSGDLIAIIDDDERIDRRWFSVIHEVFSNAPVDFIGGPYHPDWAAPPPKWLPSNYFGVIGVVDAGNAIAEYGPQFPGMLMGGNLVIRRRVLERVGLYAEALGRTGSKLLASEDDDLYQRLLAAGARGQYRPDLVIYHYIPPERLEKRYFRRWCFWRAVSWAQVEQVRPQPVRHLLGIPAYLIGRAIRGVGQLGRRFVLRTNEPATIFSDELAIWDLAGFTYGRYFYRAMSPQRAATSPLLQFRSKRGNHEAAERTAEEPPLGRAVCSNR